ncbi:MAG: putative DNA-directed DNA polymerase [Prokaryotic dsDNA virus sp.]|nr:MAG: putative DNA-directed DNA polymerase [Prokaryotic dsDNA virus sp.]|tara:strand:+ start:2579 stop:3532 length:954 start_codon:yes stop_codon:yes gene_type:complete
MSKEWKKKALELALTTDKSWRKIASKLNKPKSTVSDFLREAIKGDKIQSPIVKENAPKILLFDIETSMIEAYVWGLWNQNINISSIIKDWYVICWSARWLGDKEILHDSIHLHGDAEEYSMYEAEVVLSLWKLLDEADVVVAYNGKKFDKKKMNAKFLEYGLLEPSPYKIIDPMLIVKGNFALTSNKMDFVVRYIESNAEGKDATSIALWHKCMAGDIEALDYMLSYCDQDIEVLEKVYMAVRHWDKNNPNLALHYDDNKPRCNGCGSTDLEYLENKKFNTTLSSFNVLRCNGCGKILRDRVNTLSKDKRKSLLMNG